ncbi:MAG: chorismate synthase, partial [Candidatus Thorarchaeota archaeon]
MTFTFGKGLKIHVYGESHGEEVGVVVEGFPQGISIDESKIQLELDRRRPGSSHLVSSRSEKDQLNLRTGLFNGQSTGAPIAMSISNLDVDSSVYETIKHTPRPGHADYTARIKYEGRNDYRGGGFSSGRMTAAYVMAGSLAKQALEKQGIRFMVH